MIQFGIYSVSTGSHIFFPIVFPNMIIGVVGGCYTYVYSTIYDSEYPCDWTLERFYVSLSSQGRYYAWIAIGY